MKPQDKNWKKFKESYKDEHFDSYFFVTRREGCLAAHERFVTMNAWSRFIPDSILYHFFSWYQYSKLGWFLNGRSLKEIIFNWRR